VPERNDPDGDEYHPENVCHMDAVLSSREREEDGIPAIWVEPDDDHTEEDRHDCNRPAQVTRQPRDPRLF
jgi:hypothetical protein